jgi:hypothetical protein
MPFCDAMIRNASDINALKHGLNKSWSYIASAYADDPILGYDGKPHPAKLFCDTWSRLLKDGRIDIDEEMAAEVVAYGKAAERQRRTRLIGKLFGPEAAAPQKPRPPSSAPAVPLSVSHETKTDMTPAAAVPPPAHALQKHTLPQCSEVLDLNGKVMQGAFGKPVDGAKRAEVMRGLAARETLKVEDLCKAGIPFWLAERLNQNPVSFDEQVGKLLFLGDIPSIPKDVRVFLAAQPEAAPFIRHRDAGCKTYEEAVKLIAAGCCMPSVG